ncbi:MAG: biopolymer transport protein ExbD [Acidobacteriota bacterium]|jgi:biopolymer transport protein ExbD|nr:biopolymer transport protein ExbD [Acidobacteriota bacterium]
MNPDSANSSAKATPHINVTPLIDVLLVLLIIFMVIAPLKAARFKALVPEKPAPNRPEVPPDPLMLVVSIDRDLRLKLNGIANLGTTADPAKLVEELYRTMRAREEAKTLRRQVIDLSSFPPSGRIEKTVFIKAPRGIRYGEVARVIDHVKGAGANPVGLQIDDLDP